MKSIKITATLVPLLCAAFVTGCGDGGALSDKDAVAKAIEDDSEEKVGVAIRSVTCEEAAEDATFDYTCQGESDLGPVRSQVTKNNNVVSFVPINIFSKADAANLEDDIISRAGVSELDCGGDPPFYLPLDTMTLVCTATSAEGNPTEVTVKVNEETLQYSFEVTG